MTAATMYLNVTAMPPPTALGECTTPEIISNILMDNEDPYLHHQPQYPSYNCPSQQQMQAPAYMPGPAAPCTGPEASLPVFCGPQLASSPPMLPCTLSTPMPSPPQMANSQDHYFHQFVKEELKWTICQRRQGSGQQSLSPPETSYSTGEEVGWIGQITAAPVNSNYNNNNHNNINNNNHNNNNCYPVIENNYSYNPCIKSISSPDDCSHFRNSTLTYEDEERRKRRRERNKIAATKCRNKKKEKTAILMQESEDLQSSNANMKSEIAKLHREIERLKSVLKNHYCHKRSHHQNGQYNQSYMYNNTSCAAL